MGARESSVEWPVLKQWIPIWTVGFSGLTAAQRVGIPRWIWRDKKVGFPGISMVCLFLIFRGNFHISISFSSLGSDLAIEYVAKSTLADDSYLLCISQFEPEARDETLQYPNSTSLKVTLSPDISDDGLMRYETARFCSEGY